MATLATPDEKARYILDVFKNSNCRPGHTLRQGNFVTYFERNKLPFADIADGLKRGKERGWFTIDVNHGVTLTDPGFAEL